MAKTEEWTLDPEAARFYEERFVPAIFNEWAPRLVAAAGVTSGQRVLDVACGTGVVARTAAQEVGRTGSVVGVDLSPSMLEVAQEVQPDIEWQEGDATDLPFEDESFDAVLCQAAIMFFSDQEAALREMQRVVRPGGVVAVQVWGESAGYEATAEVLEEVAGSEVAEVFKAPFSLSDPKELVSLFEKVGFEPVNVQTNDGTARFPSLEAFLRTEIEGWVLAGQVDIDALLEASREKLKPFQADSGTVNIPMKGHIVTSRR